MSQEERSPLESVAEELENLEIEEEEEEVAEPDPKLLKSQFRKFAKFGDTAADGSTIKLSQSDKWFKQAGVIAQPSLKDSLGITTTDTAIAFKKVSKSSPKLSFINWVQYLDILCGSKNIHINLVKSRLVECGPPGTNKTTVIPKSSTVDRLTDTSRYGGTHKERFTVDGKGRGKEGRVDPESDGYVHGYKHKGSYGSGMGMGRIR